jgi:hypothetical protein
MKRPIAFGLALAWAGFMASALFAAPTGTTRPALLAGVLPAASAVMQDAGAVLPAPASPRINPQMNSANYALDWSAVGEISGGASTSASYKMNATIGQMAANTSSVSAGYGLCTGFECVLNTLSLYLPLIRRWCRITTHENARPLPSPLQGEGQG